MQTIKQHIASILALVLCIALLGGCSGNPLDPVADSIQDMGTAVGDAVGKLLSGDVTGKVGETYRTEWFDFSISSINQVDSYAGYSPAEGFTLYDVAITEISTFDDPIPMGTFDFFIDADVFDEYIYPIEALNNSMMPETFTLTKGESAEYHMVYEVPKGTQGLKLMYIEIDEEENQGATFTILLD